MVFESSLPTQEPSKKDEVHFESRQRQTLFDERLRYKNQLQAAINKENSVRKRYGDDLFESGQRELEEVQREQATAQKMIDDVDHRLRATK